MKNKKGFTLIEIIICLSLIIIIGSTSVIEINNNKKNNKIDNINKEILTSASVFVEIGSDEDGNYIRNEIFKGARGVELPLNYLVNTGYVSQENANTIYEEYSTKKSTSKDFYVFAFLGTKKETINDNCDEGLIEYTLSWDTDHTKPIYLCKPTSTDPVIEKCNKDNNFDKDSLACNILNNVSETNINNMPKLVETELTDSEVKLSMFNDYTTEEIIYPTNNYLKIINGEYHTANGKHDIKTLNYVENLNDAKFNAKSGYFSISDNYQSISTQKYRTNEKTNIISNFTGFYVIFNFSTQPDSNNTLKTEDSTGKSTCNSSTGLSGTTIYHVKEWYNIYEENEYHQVMIIDKIYKAVRNSSKAVNLLVKSSDDYSDSAYYFRGDVKNNYVDFANKCWQIIRINGNGTIRMILTDNNNLCEENKTDSTDSFILGKEIISWPEIRDENSFSYNINDKSFKQESFINSNKYLNLKKWYNELNDVYKEKLTKSYFCDDNYYSSDQKENESRPESISYKRLFDNSVPYKTDFKCDETSNLYNLFIGLINSDEIILTGYTITGRKDNYFSFLYNNNSWFLLNSSKYYEEIESFTTKDNTIYTNANSAYLRPVINLKSDITFDGNGSINTPYTIK